jgi:hypothetical protein
MTIKNSTKTPLLLMLGSFLIGGCQSNPTSEQFVNQSVAIASGIDFETTKLVAIDPETGEEVTACVRNTNAKAYSRTETPKAATSAGACKVELLVDGNDPAIRNALALSSKPIEGQIKEDGQLKPARFVVTLTSLYKGSHCNVVASGGTQYEFCGRRRH